MELDIKPLLVYSRGIISFAARNGYPLAKRVSFFGKKMRNNKGQFIKGESESVTHGFTLRGQGLDQVKMSFFRKWDSMNQRCNNKKSLSYKDYGARGIQVEWGSFEEFKDDMYQSYLVHVKKSGQRNTTIDRKNNDGNYSKENCVWATYEVQQTHTRNSRFIKFNGKTQTLMQWGIETRLGRNVIESRIDRYGWSIEEALTTPKKSNGN